MQNRAFTLIELLITMTIIVLMALVAIPGYGKQQRLIDFQNKSDEIKAGLEEMHLKAANAEKGITRYYAEVDDANKEMIFGSWDGTASPVEVYKTVKMTTDQTLSYINGPFLICDRSKAYCCNTDNVRSDCPSPGITNLSFVGLTDTDSGKVTEFKVYSNNFRIKATTTP